MAEWSEREHIYLNSVGGLNSGHNVACIDEALEGVGRLDGGDIAYRCHIEDGLDGTVNRLVAEAVDQMGTHGDARDESLAKAGGGGEDVGEGVLLLQVHNERCKGLRSMVLQLLLLSEEDAGDAWQRVSLRWTAAVRGAEVPLARAASLAAD